jgi:hypothetical protein
MIAPPPNQSKIAEDSGTAGSSWVEFFSEVFKSIRALQNSGTTAQRPTKGLYVGRPYFDTTLNRPIWYTGTNWIRADGVVV